MFLSSYLALPPRQNTVLVVITCSGLLIIAFYHLLFRGGMEFYYIFRWLNTFTGIGVVILLIYFTGRLQRYYANYDSLTGVSNRRVTYQIFHRECARAIRYGEIFSIVLIDLDRFKKINDQFGHVPGDRVLREFTMLAKKSIREADHLGRWGGDEFLLILPNTNLQNSLMIAERIRTAVSGYDFGFNYSVTASFGAVMFDNDESLEDLLLRVDGGLYEAKRLGGDRVIAGSAGISKPLP